MKSDLFTSTSMGDFIQVGRETVLHTFFLRAGPGCIGRAPCVFWDRGIEDYLNEVII